MALGSLSICPTSLNATDKKMLSLGLLQARIVVSEGIAFATLYTANRLCDIVEYLLMMTAISRAFCGKWVDQGDFDATVTSN